MSKYFDFNAPQYINFSQLDDPDADRFFDIKAQGNLEEKCILLDSSTKHNESVMQKKLNIDNDLNSLGKSGCTTKEFPNLRKVLHEIVNNQSQNDNNTPLPIQTPGKKNESEIIQKFAKLKLSESKQSQSKVPFKISDNLFTSQVNLSGRKSHHMITRLDVLNQRLNAELKDPSQCSDVHKDNETNGPCKANVNINKINSEKQENCSSTVLKSAGMKRNISPLNSTRKFISLAEQVEHFLYNTPDRFRSKPKNNISQCKTLWSSKPNTCIPKTPNLSTKLRQRKIDFPNEKQREEMELEEMKKHQIKAYPLNEKILLGPSLNLKNPIVKKPTTVPQPFSLTEVKKKEHSNEPVFHFKAQPLPATILKKPVGIPPKKVKSPTVPTTPQIRMPARLRVAVKTPEKTPSSDSIGPRNTKVEPFSFDTRMKEMLKKKEDFIRKVIETEKKSFNSFKAHPMPSFKNRNESCLKRDKTPQKTIPQPFNLTQLKRGKLTGEQDVNQKLTPFKARPAIVVHQKPFFPKIEKHEIILPTDFHLKTEKRAMERQKFDDKIKQKEEELDLILKLRREEENRLEKRLILEERKKAEFKANPMPRYKVFEIHAADPDELTLPKSPKFSCKSRVPKNANTCKESC